MPQQVANFKAEFFKALAHPIRIRIVDCLRDGEKGVNELSEMLQIEPANVSQQLAVLRFRNIVTGRKSGSSVFYSVSDRLFSSCWMWQRKSSTTNWWACGKC